MGLDVVFSSLGPVCMVLLAFVSTVDADGHCLEPLGIETGGVADSQLTASSATPGFEARWGRLNGEKAWQMDTFDQSQWLGVDLGRNWYVSAIRTQGLAPGYIESYRVVYRVNGSTEYTVYTENRQAKIFPGNADGETVSQQTLSPPVYARYVLINPVTFSSTPRLRVELLGCEDVRTETTPAISAGCYEPLGLEDGRLADDKITATTETAGFEAFRGRLNGRRAWQMGTVDRSQYLAVDLGENLYVSAVKTQGQYGGHVTDYRLVYQVDGSSALNPYRENGTEKLFPGNSDSTTAVEHQLVQPVYARYLLINPREYTAIPRMRVELFGCKEVPVESTLVSPTRAAPVEPTSPAPTTACPRPLGMEDGTIVDDLIRATTQIAGFDAFNARLNGPSAWTMGLVNTNQFLAVDFGRDVNVTGIQTQGLGEGHIKTYRIAYQADGSDQILPYLEDGAVKIFTGNSDGDSVVQQDFSPPILGRYILVNPQTFTAVPRLRIELLGCDNL
ncbi:PREDICTED: lactadherin-like [Branchiostoma belcheri]|uniref:Lactadherin-like n=1 Tax=Branchiostoma belcheri TaxID=7741 RepID=A0A6P4XP84_BRABE|nr:PREDICTED: lactadherin-like [Branchiostoma belcheri]